MSEYEWITKRREKEPKCAEKQRAFELEKFRVESEAKAAAEVEKLKLETERLKIEAEQKLKLETEKLKHDAETEKARAATEAEKLKT